MPRVFRRPLPIGQSLSALAILGCLSVAAAERAMPPQPPVALFDALSAGLISVKLVPQDATGGTIRIMNTSGRPLSLALPDAFAAVPVLAQAGPAGGGLNGGNNANNGGAGSSNQGLGGGFGGLGGLGGGGGGLGGGFFNIGVGGIRKTRFSAVCLELGKPDPNPRIPYEMRPLETFCTDRRLLALVTRFGRGEIDQPAAQAAAWHIANGLPWEQLAAKVGRRHLNGSSEPFFTADQLGRAQAITQEVIRQTTPRAAHDRLPRQ
jgi:hypothetical protein